MESTLILPRVTRTAEMLEAIYRPVGLQPTDGIRGHPGFRCGDRGWLQAWMPGTSPGKGLLQAKFGVKRPPELPLNFPRTDLQAPGGERSRGRGPACRAGKVRSAFSAAKAASRPHPGPFRPWRIEYPPERQARTFARTERAVREDNRAAGLSRTKTTFGKLPDSYCTLASVAVPSEPQIRPRTCR